MGLRNAARNARRRHHRARPHEPVEDAPLLVSFEPEGRELTGEVSLSDWAVNSLFGADHGSEAIDHDARLDWHLYLKNLEDTGTFFRDLEAN